MSSRALKAVKAVALLAEENERLEQASAKQNLDIVSLRNELRLALADVEARNEAIRALNKKLAEEYERSAFKPMLMWSAKGEFRPHLDTMLYRMTLQPERYAYEYIVRDPSDYSEGRIAWLAENFAQKVAVNVTAQVKREMTKLRDDAIKNGRVV